MINQSDNTEIKVLNAARSVFQKKGYSGARMEEIANTAGVNKALLNYYYRSKEKLFWRVFEEAFREFIPTVINILDGDLPLDMKIYRTVDVYTRMLLKNRDLPMFVLNEIRENPDKIADMFMGKMHLTFQKLEQQLSEEYEKGTIVKTTVHTFLINLLSLIVYPYIVQPLMNRMFGIGDEKFEELMLERKNALPEMIIETFKPKK
ncbi:MAG: TetR/AcrR family transcriptional regulator [Bacteroidetes bacterium]|nr:TetR/AcrR family transcriptional regulator [Bacteroidota bacterium]